MLRNRSSIPNNGRIFPDYKSSAMEHKVTLQQNINKRRKCLIWGVFNISFLGAFLYDLSYKCPMYTSWFNLLEYVAVTIFSLNTAYHFFRYVYFTIKTETLAAVLSNNGINEEQEADVLEEQRIVTPKTPITMNRTYDASLQCTPLNWSAESWRSGHSPNESQNVSIPSPSWVYYPGSAEQKSSINSTHRKLHFTDTSGVEFISDEKTLQTYLYDYEQHEKALNASNPPEHNSNLLSSFWNHPATQSPNEVSPYLRRTQYQVSCQTPSITSNAIGKTDENRSSMNISSSGIEVWRKLQIDPKTLTQWNANLRMWISQTILDRLVSEIKAVNEEFLKFHLNDVRIGNVGLERLRKTAQTMPVVQYIPTLTTLLPFLEISPNQEYLVKRIKELAKGGCMSEFKWNSGGTYNGREWDESLVNDSEIIVHLLATYLDCQLVPLPNQPDAKPFSKEHFIRTSDKIPFSPLTLAIHQVTEKPPHFALIVGEEVYEVAKGHNNMFYTVLLFLYFVNKKEHGMLGKVNMGRSGVNMLWIIEEN